MTDQQSRVIPRQQFILACIVLATVGASVLGLFFFKVPQENRDTLNFALGAIFGIAATVAGFYWPSNVGSAHKDATISDLATKLTPTDTVRTETLTTKTETVPTPTNPTQEANNVNVATLTGDSITLTGGSSPDRPEPTPDAPWAQSNL